MLWPIISGGSSMPASATTEATASLGMGGVPDDVAAELRAKHDAGRQEVVTGYWQPVLDSDPDEIEAAVTASLAQITVPYLTILGEDAGDYADWLQARIKTATTEVWGIGGHYPHLADPQRFVDRVVAFDS